MSDKSPRGKLNVEDVKSLAATAIKMGAAYSLTYFIQNISQVDLGDNSALIVMVLTVVVDTVVKVLNQGEKKE